MHLGFPSKSKRTFLRPEKCRKTSELFVVIANFNWIRQTFRRGCKRTSSFCTLRDPRLYPFFSSMVNPALGKARKLKSCQYSCEQRKIEVSKLAFLHKIMIS